MHIMAKKQTQTVKGCKKCGRTARKQAAVGTPISQYVRNVISAKDYFNLVGLSFKG